jgi:hypothetical protein
VGEHPVRDTAEADLQRGAVLDERATYLAICSATPSACGWRYSTTGVSTSTKRSMRSLGIRLSPWVRGIAGLTSAITLWAARAAAFVTSTEIPRLQVPSEPGGAT